MSTDQKIVVAIGGRTANQNGAKFEKETTLEARLRELKFTRREIKNCKNGYYYRKKYLNKTIYYAKKSSFVKLAQKIRLIRDELYKLPDEAFIIHENKKWFVKILEKRNQNCEGSVFEKLYGAVYIRDVAYKKHLYSGAIVEYAYCFSKWFKNKFAINTTKYIDLLEFYKSNNIQIFYGSDSNYIELLSKYIGL